LNGRFSDGAVRSAFLETLGFRETLDKSLGSVQAGEVTSVWFLVCKYYAMNEKISKNEYGNRLFEIIMTEKPVNTIFQIIKHA
jgi:hypothetical protein